MFSALLPNNAKLDLLPVGVMQESGVKSVLGHGVVIDPQELLTDMSRVEHNGFDLKGRLFFSDRCHLVTNLHHKIALRLNKVRKAQVPLLGECVSESFKPLRLGLRMVDILDWPSFTEKY